MAEEMSPGECSDSLIERRPVWPAPVRHPSRFSCRLDDQPAFLLPRRLLEAPIGEATAPQLIVNSSCWFSSFGDPPARVAACLPVIENFDGGEGSVWVTDAASGILLPFALGAHYCALTSGFRPGASPPRRLPQYARDVLSVGRILIAPDHEESRRLQWVKTIADASQQFQNGYAPIPGLIHPFHLGALRRYYRYSIRTGRFRLGDGQSPRRFVAHNENVTRFFHQQLTETVSAIVGEPVKPSYCYFASYQSGAMLPRHTDRPQCEFSVTLLMDCSPEPDIESPWPLQLDTPGGITTVYQAIGDGLVYLGRTLPHHRPILPDGWTSTSVFFHYVRADYVGKLD
jgi:hypothetical protein